MIRVIFAAAFLLVASTVAESRQKRDDHPDPKELLAG